MGFFIKKRGPAREALGSLSSRGSRGGRLLAGRWRRLSSCTPQPDCKPTCLGGGSRAPTSGPRLPECAEPDPPGQTSLSFCAPRSCLRCSGTTQPSPSLREEEGNAFQATPACPRARHLVPERTEKPLNAALAAGVRGHRALPVCRHGASVTHPQGARLDTTGPSPEAGPVPTDSASGSRGTGGPGRLLVRTADGQGHSTPDSLTVWTSVVHTHAMAPVASASTPHTWAVPSHFRGPSTEAPPACGRAVLDISGTARVAPGICRSPEHREAHVQACGRGVGASRCNPHALRVSSPPAHSWGSAEPFTGARQETRNCHGPQCGPLAKPTHTDPQLGSS